MLPDHVVVPIDFSDPAEQALDYACQLAGKLGATIHLVHAIGPIGELPLGPQLLDELGGERRRALEELAARRREHATFGPPILEVADPRDAILDAVEKVGAELIVMSTHGRRGLSRVLLGSVAESVIRRAPCPVLVVRPVKQGGTS